MLIVVFVATWGHHSSWDFLGSSWDVTGMRKKSLRSPHCRWCSFLFLYCVIWFHMFYMVSYVLYMDVI